MNKGDSTNKGILDVLLTTATNDLSKVVGRDNGMSLKLTRHYELFRRFNIVEELDAPEPCVSMVFFTRPDLALFDENCNPLPSIDDMSMRYLLSTNPRLYSYLDTSIEKDSEFIPIMTSSFIELSLPDRNVETQPSVSNRYGMSTMLPRQMGLDHQSGTISVSFNNDYSNNIAKIADMIVRYQEGLIDGTIIPKIDNSLENIIDYSMSIFGITLSSDGKRIKRWFEIPGVFLTNTVDSSGKVKNIVESEEVISLSFKLNLPIEYNSLASIFRFNTLMKNTKEDFEYATNGDYSYVDNEFTKQPFNEGYYTNKYIIVSKVDEAYDDVYFELVSKPYKSNITIQELKNQDPEGRGYVTNSGSVHPPKEDVPLKRTLEQAAGMMKSSTSGESK